MQKKQEEVLKEIKLRPSNELKLDRFKESDAAACSGKCVAGSCRTFV